MEKTGEILVILPGALGDVINTIPALKALRDHFPEAKIEAAGNRERMELLKAGRIVDSIRDLEIPEFHTLFSENIPPGENIKNFLERFDLIISWLRDKEGIIECNLQQMVKHSIFFNEKFPPQPGSLPVSIILSQPVRELGIHKLPPWPELELSDACSKRTADLIGDDLEKFMVVHPGSGSKTKCWPAERFARVVEALTRDTDLQVIALEGPADREAAGELLKESRDKVRVVKDLPAIDMACIIGRAKIYIGNDSGVSHLAAALGVPSVVVFGPTDPGVWGPRQPWGRIITPDLDCAPCGDDERRACNDLRCLESVPVSDVLQSALELILESGT